MKKIPSVESSEVRALARKYGKPQRVTCQLNQSPVTSSKNGDRRAEVVLAIRNDRNKVLLHTKSFYPDGVFRLLSGGINWDETVERALLREAKEETGLDVSIEQFVALIEYANADSAYPFASYVFLLKGDEDRPTLQRGKERITAFKSVSAEGLRVTARALRSLPARWREWGVFRAVAHELAAGALEERKAMQDEADLKESG